MIKDFLIPPMECKMLLEEHLKGVQIIGQCSAYTVCSMMMMMMFT
jgi:hypothetical protein